jgi:hypothetical protein
MAPKSRPRRNKEETPLTSAVVENLIAQKVADALAEYEADQSVGTDGSGGGTDGSGGNANIQPSH